MSPFSIKFTRIRYYRLLSLTVVLTASLYLKAQEESCTQNLIDAQETFTKGQIEEVPLMLESCLKRGFSKQEKISAYRLLTLSHLYYNRLPEAAEAMQKMLSLDPEYQIRDIDPSEFVNLHSTFRTSPIVIIGPKIGIGGFNLYNITNYNDINPKEATQSYSTGTSLLGGVSIEVPIIKHLSFVTGFYYNLYEYQFKRTILGYSSITATENVTGIQAPFSLQWNILKNRQVTPYVNAGVDLYYLLSAKIGIDRVDTLGDYTDHQVATTDPIDVKSSRNSLNYAYSAGIGVRIKIKGKGYVTFDVRYLRYMKEHVSEENRANDASLTYNYLYTDNSFKKEDFQCLIGYKIPIYLPRQRKSARIEN